jgi:hypothetical protein
MILNSGAASCSNTRRAGHAAKNRIPCPWGTHPVTLRDTYGWPPDQPPYVSLGDTHIRTESVSLRDTHLDCHSGAQP